MRFEENDDIIDICRDNVFKAVFTKDTHESRFALSRLISAMIGSSVSVTAIAANEPAVENLHERQIRFDIACRSDAGELCNIEMTLFPDDFEPVRLEYYAGKLFTGQNIRGKDKTFGDLHRAYQIAFLVNRNFWKDDDFVHEFEYYDITRKKSLGGKSRIITVELSKLEKVVTKTVKDMNEQELWAIFFRYLKDADKRQKINEILEREEGIAMAGETLYKISKDDIERARLMSEFKYELDTQSKLVQATRKGVAQGITQGIAQGRTEGRTEAVVEMAKKMKSSGLAAERIADFTGLSADEIARL